MANALQLTENELSERIQSNKQTVIDNRLGWAQDVPEKSGRIYPENIQRKAD